MSLEIGKYLHIQVLEYLFDILIFRHFFLIFEVFPGAYPLFKGGLGPILQLNPHFCMANMLLHTVRVPNQQLPQKFILGGDYPLKKCDAVHHNI